MARKQFMGKRPRQELKAGVSGKQRRQSSTSVIDLISPEPNVRKPANKKPRGRKVRFAPGPCSSADGHPTTEGKKPERVRYLDFE